MRSWPPIAPIDDLFRPDIRAKRTFVDLQDFAEQLPRAQRPAYLRALLRFRRAHTKADRRRRAEA
jgi:hypothetical protein